MLCYHQEFYHYFILTFLLIKSILFLIKFIVYGLGGIYCWLDLCRILMSFLICLNLHPICLYLTFSMKLRGFLWQVWVFFCLTVLLGKIWIIFSSSWRFSSLSSTSQPFIYPGILFCHLYHSRFHWKYHWWKRQFNPSFYWSIDTRHS